MSRHVSSVLFSVDEVGVEYSTPSGNQSFSEEPDSGACSSQRLSVGDEVRAICRETLEEEVNSTGDACEKVRGDALAPLNRAGPQPDP